MADKPDGEKGDGMAASRFATSQSNPFYRGPLDPRHRDPTALLLDTSSGNIEAKPVERTYQTWHRIEETNTRIIFHLDEINVLIKGVVKNKDGSTDDQAVATVTPATANLSIVMDKTMVFGRQNLNLTDKGHLLEDDSVLKINLEGDGTKGSGPALEIAVSRAETEKNPATDASQLQSEQISTMGGGKPLTNMDVHKPTSTALQQENEKPTRGRDVVDVGKSRSGTNQNDQVTKFKEEGTSKPLPGPSDKPPSRCVLITGLPPGFSLDELLKNMLPTPHTLIIDIKKTKTMSLLLEFYTPRGARNFLGQIRDGTISFNYHDPELGGTSIWQAKPQLWGEYVPVPNELKNQIENFGATRYLSVTGRKPTTMMVPDRVWTINDYRVVIQREIYDGKVRRLHDGVEVAELEFLSVSQAVYAKHLFRRTDGFATAQYDFLPDPFVRRDDV